MFRFAALSALALAGWAAMAHGQVIVSSSPVRTTYYAGASVPAPVVSYYAPVGTLPPSLPPSLPPITTYYGPSTVTSYYSPQPFYTYYSAPAYYAPTTAYYSPVVVGSPVVAGRSAYGTVRAYVPAQPVRNAYRFVVP